MCKCFWTVWMRSTRMPGSGIVNMKCQDLKVHILHVRSTFTPLNMGSDRVHCCCGYMCEGSVWLCRVRGVKSARRASVCHCLSFFPLLAEESGNEMWSSEWNIKQLAAAWLSGHLAVRWWPRPRVSLSVHRGGRWALYLFGILYSHVFYKFRFQHVCTIGLLQVGR